MPVSQIEQSAVHASQLAVPLPEFSTKPALHVEHLSDAVQAEQEVGQASQTYVAVFA